MNYTSAHQRLKAIVAVNPDLLEDFGGRKAFDALIDRLEGVDSEFSASGRDVWHLEDTSPESIASFEKIHAIEYRNGPRPSLVALTDHYFDTLGILKEGNGADDYDRALVAAALAEVEVGDVPAYHNVLHFMDVFAVTAQSLRVNDILFDDQGAHYGAVYMDDHAKAVTLIAALGHDLGHEGGGNPDDKPYFYEDRSIAALSSVMKKMGMDDKDLHDLDLIIKTTSPKGPHEVIKKLGLAEANNKDVSWDDVDPENKFPELRDLDGDKLLIAQAAILHGADLFASSASLGSNVRASSVLTEEFATANNIHTAEDAEKALSSAPPRIYINFNEAKNRAFFLDNIVGKEGFAFAPSVNFIIEAAFNSLRDVNSMLLEFETSITEGLKNSGATYLFPPNTPPPPSPNS